MKNKEKLEEAIKREYEARKFNSDFPFDPQSFKLGAKWEAKRRYSEEDILNLLNFVNDRLLYSYSRFSPEKELKEWLE